MSEEYCCMPNMITEYADGEREMTFRGIGEPPLMTSRRSGDGPPTSFATAAIFCGATSRDLIWNTFWSVKMNVSYVESTWFLPVSARHSCFRSLRSNLPLRYIMKSSMPWNSISGLTLDEAAH
jgi:hypothetical protein